MLISSSRAPRGSVSTFCFKIASFLTHGLVRPTYKALYITMASAILRVLTTSLQTEAVYLPLELVSLVERFCVPTFLPRNLVQDAHLYCKQVTVPTASQRCCIYAFCNDDSDGQAGGNQQPEFCVQVDPYSGAAVRHPRLSILSQQYVALSSDGRRICWQASDAEGFHLRFADLTTEESDGSVGKIETGFGMPWAMLFCPTDPHLIAVRCANIDYVDLFRLGLEGRSERVARFALQHAAVQQLVWLTDGRHMASSHRSGHMQILSVPDGAQTLCLEAPDSFDLGGRMYFAPNSRFFLAIPMNMFSVVAKVRCSPPLLRLRPCFSLFSPLLTVRTLRRCGRSRPTGQRPSKSARSPLPKRAKPFSHRTVVSC